MRPRRAANCVAAAAKAARCDTSTAKSRASPPAARMLSAVARLEAASTSTTPTVAPSAASLRATARPRPRPAPVISTAWPANSLIRASSLGSLERELPGRTLAHDPARARIAEVAADDQRLALLIALDERAPRARALSLVHVEVGVQVRHGELDRVMHHVAGDHRLLTARGNAHAHVARRVSGRRLEPHLIG